MKCSQTTRRVTRSDMKDSSIKLRMSSRVLTQIGEGRTAAWASEPWAVDLGKVGGDKVSPSPTRPPDPCVMTRDLRLAAGLEPRDHAAGRSTISPYFFLFDLTAQTPFSHSKHVCPNNACATMHAALQNSSSSSTSMGKGEDRGSPVFIPFTWSFCDSHKRSHRSALAKTGPTLRGTQMKAHSAWESLREHAYTVKNASQKSRQHTDCVKYICREERTAICSRPSTSFVALIATVELNLSACKRQTTPNKTHNREWQSQRVVVAEWQNLTPVPPHVLLCFLVSTSPRPWCLPHPLVCLHTWLRAWSRWRRSHSSSTQLKFLKRNFTQGVCHSSRLNCSLMTSSATSRLRLDFHHIKFYFKNFT